MCDFERILSVSLLSGGFGKLLRDGRVETLAKNVLVAASSGTEVFYVASDAPTLLRSIKPAVNPPGLFGADDDYLDRMQRQFTG